MKFYPYKKGRAEKVIAILSRGRGGEGLYEMFWGSFTMGA